MEQKKAELISAARKYRDADRRLEVVCEDRYDPIACTVFAMKNKHTEHLPAESFDASHWLQEVTKLHGELVSMGLSNDDVRSIWFPILNGP